MPPTSVMIADREPVALDLLNRLVRSFADFCVTGVFSDALNLRAAVDCSPPDLAIVDPWLDGITHACQSFTNAHPRVRVIFLDRSFQTYQLKRAFACGAQAYLTKKDALIDFEASLRLLAAGEQTRLRSIVSHVHKYCTLNPGLLTIREVEVMRHLAANLTLRASAQCLGTSEAVVQNIHAQLLRKLQLHQKRAVT